MNLWQTPETLADKGVEIGEVIVPPTWEDYCEYSNNNPLASGDYDTAISAMDRFIGNGWQKLKQLHEAACKDIVETLVTSPVWPVDSYLTKDEGTVWLTDSDYSGAEESVYSIMIDLTGRDVAAWREANREAIERLKQIEASSCDPQVHTCSRAILAMVNHSLNYLEDTLDDPMEGAIDQLFMPRRPVDQTITYLQSVIHEDDAIAFAAMDELEKRDIEALQLFTESVELQPLSITDIEIAELEDALKFPSFKAETEEDQLRRQLAESFVTNCLLCVSIDRYQNEEGLLSHVSSFDMTSPFMTLLDQANEQLSSCHNFPLSRIGIETRLKGILSEYAQTVHEQLEFGDIVDVIREGMYIQEPEESDFVVPPASRLYP